MQHLSGVTYAIPGMACITLSVTCVTSVTLGVSCATLSVTCDIECHIYKIRCDIGCHMSYFICHMCDMFNIRNTTLSVTSEKSGVICATYATSDVTCTTLGVTCEIV